MNHSEIVSFLWGIADLIRDTFKWGKYQDVILPLTVLRRLDCVLAPTKEKVLRRQADPAATARGDRGRYPRHRAGHPEDAVRGDRRELSDGGPDQNVGA